jgi:hypothetical protein
MSVLEGYAYQKAKIDEKLNDAIGEAEHIARETGKPALGWYAFQQMYKSSKLSRGRGNALSETGMLGGMDLAADIAPVALGNTALTSAPLAATIGTLAAAGVVGSLIHSKADNRAEMVNAYVGYVEGLKQRLEGGPSGAEGNDMNDMQTQRSQIIRPPARGH